MIVRVTVLMLLSKHLKMLFPYLGLFNVWRNKFFNILISLSTDKFCALFFLEENRFPCFKEQKNTCIFKNVLCSPYCLVFLNRIDQAVRSA